MLLILRHDYIIFFSVYKNFNVNSVKNKYILF